MLVCETPDLTDTALGNPADRIGDMAAQLIAITYHYMALHHAKPHHITKSLFALQHMTSKVTLIHDITFHVAAPFGHFLLLILPETTW